MIDCLFEFVPERKKYHLSRKLLSSGDLDQYRNILTDVGQTLWNLPFITHCAQLRDMKKYKNLSVVLIWR